MLEYPLLFVFPVAMVFAGAFDLLTMTIPNRVSGFLCGAFVVAAYFAGLSMETFLWHLGVGAAVLAAGIAFYSMKWIGGGDAKLLAAASLWIGADNFVLYLGEVAVLGGVLAVIILAYRQFPLDAFPLPEWALRLHKRGSGIPYGLAIAGAALMIYPDTAWFAAFSA